HPADLQKELPQNRPCHKWSQSLQRQVHHCHHCYLFDLFGMRLASWSLIINRYIFSFIKLLVYFNERNIKWVTQLFQEGQTINRVVLGTLLIVSSICPYSIKLSARGNIEYFRKNLYKGIKLSLCALAQFTSNIMLKT